MVSPITATTALNLNQEMTDFNYKKYSLENLENWLHDAMSCGETTPQEIYDVIVGVVKENYYIYKHQTSQAYELLALLNSGVDNNKYQDYLNEILSCDKDDPSPECKGAWNDFWESNNTVEYDLREAEYYNKEVFVSEDGDIYPTRDKVVKWQLPVEVDGLTGECFIQLPDDLLEAANLKEGDQVEWIDRNDGSFELRKVNGTK
jgi:hypothetical protein